MTEEEKRKHRCCFSGQRPEKLSEDEATVKAWLREQIEAAVASGCTTFISGCSMGVDIWSGQIVISLRDEEKIRRGSTNLRLIAATPWPGFSNKWAFEWQQAYSNLLRDADLIIPVSKRFSQEVFRQRNEWMVDHSARIIAYYNGEPGGTRDTIEYAKKKGIEVISNEPYHIRGEAPLLTDYPENLVTAIGLDLFFPDGVYKPLTDDQMNGLDHVLAMIKPREAEMIRLRYQEKKTLQMVGDEFSLSRERIRQVIEKSLWKIRYPGRLAFIRDGYEKTELSLKLVTAEEIRKQLGTQRKRYPLMNEEDIVKFVFQGMLGNGHLISSPEDAMERLKTEYDNLDPSDDEPLTEKISAEWLRLNLRPAKAKELDAADIASWVYESAQTEPLSFTRQNVYNFCVKAYPTDAMREAAKQVLNGNWLPSHSETYRSAYHPAYRVLRTAYRKFMKGR